MDPARAAVRPVTTIVPGSDARRVSDVGRRARLELAFESRGARTLLAHGYAEPPLRVGRCLDEDRGARLILTSSAPGIFGGDVFTQHVDVAAGARVRLTSQSALQVHPGHRDETASIDSRYHVADGGQLRCEWDPLIPFAGARLQQRVAIDLAETATLVWSDAVMSGRESRGEHWQFTSLAHELRLTRGGRLIYLERYDIQPARRSMSRRWTAHDARYFGTAIIVASRANDVSAERVHRALNGVDAVVAAADAIADGVVLVRLASPSGVRFRQARATLASDLATATV